ncbi:MAG: tetratricopeptide repeat protein [Treponema sp.]|nr:tetratricopeptide repeat protein [Treponema sp.]
MKKLVIALSACALLATACQKSNQTLVTPVGTPSATPSPAATPSSSAAPAPAASSGDSAASGTPDLSQALAIPAPQSAAPTTKEGWISLGNQQMDSGNYSDAIFAYGKALELDPSNVDVRVDMGTCYRNIGQPQQAITIYKKALQINPRHPNAWRNSGVVYYYDLHDNANALVAFRKYLEVSPQAADAAQILQTIATITAKK